MAVIKFRKLDRPGFWLQVDAEATETSLTRNTTISHLDGHLEEIQRWCDETECGRRMAYDMWKFRKRADMTAFLLRWA
jgi:hypothetical protein